MNVSVATCRNVPLQESKKAEFVWELKRGFCEGGCKQVELSAYKNVCLKLGLPLLYFTFKTS